MSTLQLYLEGSTYEPETESWVLAPADSSAGGSFRLWAIGNVGGPGGKGEIENVRLVVVYDSSFGELDFSLIGATTGGYGGFADISLPDPLIPAQTEFVSDVATGGVPLLGDGKSLPTHGRYVPGKAWQEFYLGDFDQTDSPIADFIDTFPTPDHSGGQINVYEISVAGAGGARLHFALHDTAVAKNHAKFAPFSHDVEITPVPAAAWLWFALLGGMGVVGAIRRTLRTA